MLYVRDYPGEWIEDDLRLNMSSMRLVITNPPETLTKASPTARAPRAWGMVSGTYPPPMMKKPPTPTIPKTGKHVSKDLSSSSRHVFT